MTDARYKALTQYKTDLGGYLSQPLSEADTRAKFIDVFLKDILGWQEEDLRRERTFWTDEKKAAIDYEVGRPRVLFLVEAKRLSIDFEFPNSSGRHLYRLDGVIASCPCLWDAVQGTEVLIEYLTGEEDKEHVSGTLDRSPILQAVSFMPSIGSQLRSELKAIQRSLERQGIGNRGLNFYQARLKNRPLNFPQNR